MEPHKRRKKEWTKEEIKSLRQHLKLTQVKLAEELGTRQQTISEWEQGMYRPRGASATLLSIIAERSGFTYRALNKAEGLAGEKRDESEKGRHNK